MRNALFSPLTHTSDDGTVVALNRHVHAVRQPSRYKRVAEVPDASRRLRNARVGYSPYLSFEFGDTALEEPLACEWLQRVTANTGVDERESVGRVRRVRLKIEFACTIAVLGFESLRKDFARARDLVGRPRAK
ncbi:MAG: hypothetical protein NVS3B20_05700 [Polyangiales bacterium]